MDSADREPTSWFLEVDEDILGCIEGKVALQPRRISSLLDIKDIPFIQNRCKELAIHGLLQELNEGEFKITEAGLLYLQGEIDCNSIAGSFDRLIDLSYFDAEDIKYRNAKFLRESDRYTIRTDETKSDVNSKIWRVRNGDIRRLLRRFPRDVPLVEQCAYWMRAWTGKHFFRDANHRTSFVLLRNLLQERDFDIVDWSTNRSKQAVRESKIERRKRYYSLETLFLDDEHYLVWWFYFIDVLPDRLKY